MEHFIGIDNSSTDHKIKIINNNGEILYSMTIDNNLKGFEKLNSKIINFPNSKIGFELPHGPLIDFLKSKKHKIFSINPLKIKRFKEVNIISGNKTDDIDALAIAEYMKINQKNIQSMKFNSSEIEKLKSLSVVHTNMTENHARHLNKLRFVVRQYFPLHDSLFGDFGGKVHLKLLLKYPTWDVLKKASEAEIKQFLLDSKYRNFVNIEKLITKIRKHGQIICSNVEYAFKISATSLCQQLLIIKETLKELEDKMVEITDNHKLGDKIKSLPGAGPILTGKILSIFGDNKDRFKKASDAQCLFGTAPKNYQSGSYHKVHMRRACDKQARAVLYKFAFSSLNYSQWAREYYDKQREKGKTNSVSVRALSNEWVKVIFSMWKNETMYDESRKLKVA